MPKNNPVQPDGIAYWVNDRPPFYLSLILAVQQIAFLGSIMTLPVILGRAAGLGIVEEANLVALTMIAAGIGVMLQAMNKFGIGIGLFAPMHTSSVAFPAALVAVQTGGLGLAFGMMSVAGLVQITASLFVHRLRAFFPVEIAGLTVFMLGSGLGVVGLKSFLAIDTQFEGDPNIFIVGFTTLAIIISLNIWTKGKLHAFSVFIGLVCGQLVALYLDLVPHEAVASIKQAALFSIPKVGQFGWSFDWALLVNFIIVGIALSFNCFGVMTIAQRANDAAWKRPDIHGISRGLMAEGLTNVACSAINGVTQTASGGAVGLSQASGITSRIVAFVLGIMFIALSFFPTVTMIWTALSPAVIGAVLMFVGSFITLGGLKILTSRLLDNRKIIALGLAIIAGVGNDNLLTQIDDLPAFLDVITATSLSVTVIVAILLNALFRLGSKKSLRHNVSLNEDWHEEVSKIIWHLGRSWGARPEVVVRLEHATNDLIDTVYGHKLIDGEVAVQLSARFDEYLCQLTMEYTGQSFNIPEQRPDPESLLDNPDAVCDMAGYLVRRMADKVSVQKKNGKVRITLSFEE